MWNTYAVGHFGTIIFFGFEVLPTTLKSAKTHRKARVLHRFFSSGAGYVLVMG